MAGKIIADTIQAAGDRINLNVGELTILTANSSGLTYVPTGNININVGAGGNLVVSSLNSSSINVTTLATVANAAITRNSIDLTQYGKITANLNLANTNGFLFPTAGLGLKADIQGSGALGLNGFNNAAIPTGTTVDICKSHWGGLALINFAGSGVQGMRVVAYGYNGTPTVLHSSNWQGSLTTTFSTSQYTLRVSHTNGTDVQFWGIHLGS